MEGIKVKNFFHYKQDNKVICFLPAYLLTDKIVVSKNGHGFGSYSDINDLMSDLSAEDNPIMVIGDYNFDSLFTQ